MNYFTKAVAVTLIPLLALNFCLPGISSAAQSFSSPLAGEGGVRGGVRGQILLAAADVRTGKAQPEVLATPEEDIPVEKIEKGGVSWWWIILGVAAVGGVVAVAGGGKSDSSSSSSGGGGSGNGSVTVGW